MATCSWCDGEMTKAISCTVDAFHRDGRRLHMVPFGDESGRRTSAARCGDCGVTRGGWHHPGCDLQRCPACGDQLMSCGCLFDEDEVIIHRDDVPESDVTTVRGIRCTTALRTVIDVAPDVEAEHLEEIVQDCLERGLFTVEEAWRRLAESDMADRRGAELLRRALPPPAT